MKDDKQKPEVRSKTTDKSDEALNPENQIIEKVTIDESLPKKPTKNQKKVWYKNPVFWVGIAAAAIGIISITLGLIYRSNVLKSHQTISDGWYAITAKADSVVVLQNKLAQTKNYDEYSSSLHSLESTVRDRKYAAEKLPSFLTDKAGTDRYNDFLNDFGSYSGKAASMSDQPGQISDTDEDELADLNRIAEESTNELKNNANYLQQNMPADIFKIPETLQAVRDAISTQKKLTEAEKQAAANAAAKDVADKQSVTNSVTGFQEGYIAADSAKMRRFMTPGFQNEYNFNQLSPEQRQYQYPSSFRIISVTKQTDGTYKAQVNVLFKYTDNSNQYTVGYEYSVINASNSWLLNNEKQTNSF